MAYQNKGGNGEVIQAIKAHFDIVNYMEHRGYSFKQVGAELYCNEISGFCINASSQQFFDHKAQRGGSIIDLVMYLDNLTMPNAISLLRKEMGTYDNTQVTIDYKGFEKLKKEKDIELKLPPKLSGKYTRVFAYLTKSRGIDGKIVSDIVSRKMLYEDGKYHNCVFVGYDYDKKAKFACTRVSIDKSMSPKYILRPMRGEKNIQIPTGVFISNDMKSIVISKADIKSSMLTALMEKGLSEVSLCYADNPISQMIKNKTLLEIKQSGFSGNVKEVTEFSVSEDTHKQVTEPFSRGDVENSMKKVAWFVDNNSTSLFVCEAPVDALSVMSLLKLGGKDYNKYSYLAQSGCSSTSSLLYHVKNNPQISKVYLCYDNDTAGKEALMKATRELHESGFKGSIINKIPKNNDFNDDLLAHRRQLTMMLQQNIVKNQEVTQCVSH